MEAWDEALLEACDRYPHMRIYDWAADVRDPWFIPDGIHFTSEGYAERGRLIADALLEAFPNTGAAEDGRQGQLPISSRRRRPPQPFTFLK